MSQTPHTQVRHTGHEEPPSALPAAKHKSPSTQATFTQDASLADLLMGKEQRPGEAYEIWGWGILLTEGTDVSMEVASPKALGQSFLQGRSRTRYSLKTNVSYHFPPRHFHLNPVGIPKHVVKKIWPPVQDLAPNFLSNLTVPLIPLQLHPFGLTAPKQQCCGLFTMS